MAQQTSAMTDGSGENHPAADVETVVVDPDDVIAVMKRNNRDQDERRSHVLRVTPPLAGELTATLHVSEEGAYYPPEMDPKPIHIGARPLLTGHIDKQIDAYLRHPSLSDSRSRFREEFDVYGPDGDYRELTDDEQAEFDEWWETEMEVWESEVRSALVDSIELSGPVASGEWESTTIDVRYESDDE